MTAEPSPLDAPDALASPSEPPGEAAPRRRGGRPKGDPAAVRVETIGVRVSVDEYTTLKAKAEQMGMSPAQWLREAALTRRLPAPPVPAVNREEYAELARLAGNLNQLTRLANTGEPVTLSDALVGQLSEEVRRLRLSLINAERP